MTYEVRELAPLHFQCSEADDFADLLQLVLHHAGLRYTVPDANILLVSPAPRVPHKGWFRSSLLRCHPYKYLAAFRHLSSAQADTSPGSPRRSPGGAFGGSLYTTPFIETYPHSVTPP